MNTPIARPLALLSAWILPACAAAPELSRVDPVVADCAAQDVVFFGELHGNAACHQQQLWLLKALHTRRPDIVVSVEVFERDVQPVVDAYLAGELDEAEFRRRARASKNWPSYRPILKYAAENRLPVIAANAPLELVRKVSRKDGGGLASLAGNQLVAQEVSAPRDAYFEDFVAKMTASKTFAELSAAKQQGMVRFYTAQCLRDETMAESITSYLSKAHAAGRRPLILHLTGAMHSDKRRGTVQRALRRAPNLKVRVITTTTDLYLYNRTASGDLELIVPKTPRATKSPSKHPTGPAQPHTASKSKPTPKAKAKTEDVESFARPGLGFKPAYESEQDGVEVEFVVEGSAAEKGGIKAGDVITKLAGQEVEDVRAYTDVLGGLKVGQTVDVVLMRKGKKQELKVVVGESHR